MDISSHISAGGLSFLDIFIGNPMELNMRKAICVCFH